MRSTVKVAVVATPELMRLSWTLMRSTLILRASRRVPEKLPPSVPAWRVANFRTLRETIGRASTCWPPEVERSAMRVTLGGGDFDDFGEGAEGEGVVDAGLDGGGFGGGDGGGRYCLGFTRRGKG